MYNWPANEFLSLPYPNSQLANQKAALLFWGAKNVLSKTKLQDARQLRRQVLERSDWNNGVGVTKFFAEFVWILEISKMKLQTNELKRCQKRNLIDI